MNRRQGRANDFFTAEYMVHISPCVVRTGVTVAFAVYGREIPLKTAVRQVKTPFHGVHGARACNSARKYAIKGVTTVFNADK